MHAASPSHHHVHLELHGLRRRATRRSLQSPKLLLRCAAACTLLCTTCAVISLLIRRPQSSRPSAQILQRAPHEQEAIRTAVSIGEVPPLAPAEVDLLGALKGDADSFADNRAPDVSTRQSVQDDAAQHNAWMPVSLVANDLDPSEGVAAAPDGTAEFTDPDVLQLARRYSYQPVQNSTLNSTQDISVTPAQTGAEGAPHPEASPGLAAGAPIDDAHIDTVSGGDTMSPEPVSDGAGGVDDGASAATHDAADAALQEGGCAAVATGAPTHHLRVRHSATPAVDLERDLELAAGHGNTSTAGTDPMTYQFPFRVPEVPGARAYGEVQWCPGSLEPPPEAVPPVDPAYRALFVIGAQKAGTTWLHNAFAKHPAMVQGETRIKSRQGKHYKELQFFNAWPARSTEEFLSMWPPAALAAMRRGSAHRFLFDATPEYLLNAAVAPRMKQMVPQARIVVVLRDPTERAFSSWSMTADRGRFCDSKKLPMSRLCVERTFHDTFSTWHGSHADRPECRFTTPGANVSWGDCAGCRYNLFAYNECCKMRQEHGDALFPCFGVPRGFSVLDYSAYAAQLAWWLEFFPPEQIYVVASDTLRDETKRVKVLNDLLDFVGLPNARRFTAAAVNRASAFEGGYRDVVEADVAAKATVSRFHATQVRDLRALLARFWPDVELPGFPE